MAASVTPIRAGLEPETPGEVRADVVTQLEMLLEQAKAGELQGLAFVGLFPGGLTTYHDVGKMTRGVLGALALLQGCLVKNDLENS